MVITVASYKGGVGKSTTAVHLAAYLQQQAPTVLIDGDPNRSVCGWALNGNLPFNVIHLHQAARLARNYEHAIIDTNARPEPEEISELVQGCDLLIIPTTPDALSLQALQMSLVARIGMETEFPLSPSGSVRRCVRTQAVRARSLCSGLFGRVGSP